MMRDDMKKNVKEYEDDGRTIADMSGVDQRNVLSGLLFFRHPYGKRQNVPEDQGSEPPVSPDERRMWVFGALRAALLVALAYIGVLGGAIALMVLLWRH